nr:unnamed protein product [Digitaria exilis]
MRKECAGDGWCWLRSRLADGTPRSGGFMSAACAASVVGRRPKVEVALLLLPLLLVRDLAPGDDRSEASAPAEAAAPPENPSGSEPGNPKPAALPRSWWWCWRGGSISPGAAMIQLRNVCSWPAAAAASPSMASQPSSPTSPTSRVPGIGGSSPPAHSSFLAPPPPPPPPPCSPGAAHLVASAAAALFSEIAATPEDESPAAPPRDEDSVDGGLGLRLQSSTDVGSSSSRSPPPRPLPPPPAPAFPSGQISASIVPAPFPSAVKGAALIYLLPHARARAPQPARSGGGAALACGREGGAFC